MLLRGPGHGRAGRGAAPAVELLSGLDLLAGSDRNVLERLAKGALDREVPAQTVRIREGEQPDALWVLVEGSLSISAKGEDDRALELPVVHAPAYVGELGLLRGTPRTATVHARESSRLLRIEAADFSRR